MKTIRFSDEESFRTDGLARRVLCDDGGPFVTSKRQIPLATIDDDRSAESRGRKSHRRQFRLNLKAAVVLAVVAVLIGAGALVIQKNRMARFRSQVIAEALDLEKSGHLDQSIRSLRRYLDAHPGDLEALELLARIMAQSARSVDEAMDAALVNDQLLRRDPEGAGRQETRRRMVDLYVRCGDSHRASAIYRLAPDKATFELRYRAAKLIADDLLKRGKERGKKPDPKDYRLLAMALEGLAVPGDRAALEASIDNYEIARKGDPTDGITAERLARLYQERMNDPAKAELILDELVLASPRSPEVRLIRHRYFMGVHRNDLAAIELEKATELAPGELNVRLTAASDALRRGDAAAAKRHLAGIPESRQSDLRVRVMRGMIEFSEERPDEAIVSWRQGLLMIGGTDADLTWWLAHALLQMGRIAEARPLVSQYHRLSGDETQPLYRFLQAELDEKTGRPVRAILGLEWAKERIGEYWQAMIHIALGRCYEALWDQPKALIAYRRAIQIDPQLPDPRIAVARLLARKPEEAALEIERGLATVPDEPSLRIALVAARLQQQSNRPAALRSWPDFDRDLARAVEIMPANSALLLMRADRLALGGDLPAAVSLLERAAAGSPRNAALWTAWSTALVRLGRPLEALKVLERASGPDAAGDRAPIRVARARLLLARGRGREAREVLIRGEQDMSIGDRPAIWEAVGQLDATRGDFASARASFSQWSRLLPDDPRPRLALVELAQVANDEAAIHSTVEALRELGGPEDIAWRLSRAQELLWLHPTPVSAGAPRRDPRLGEAVRLLEAILSDAPEIPVAHLLRGQAMERLNRTDEAIASFRRAWDRGTTSALPKLVELLVRNRKFDDLAGLKLNAQALGLDQLSAVVSLRAGDFESGSRFAEMAVKESDNAPGTRSWQAKVLEAIGRPDRAEPVLLAVAEQTPTEIEPWLELIRNQASRGKVREASATVERAKGLIKADDRALMEARLRWAANDRPAADLAIETTIANRRDDPKVRLIAARYFEDTGRPREAVACLRAALKIDPKSRGAARQLGVLLSNEPGTWAEAARLFGPETSSDNSPEERLARALVLSRAGDRDRKQQAITLLDGLMDDLPAGDPLANVARVQLIQLLVVAGQVDKAMQIGMVLAESSSNLGHVRLYAETLLLARKLPEALRQIDRMETLKPGDPSVAQLRVRWVLLSSKPGEAADALERAVVERKDRLASETLSREAFNTLIAMQPQALDQAERVARIVAGLRPSASWMQARVLAFRGKPDEALDLSRPSADSDLPEDRSGAAEVAMTVATANGTDPILLAKAETILETALGRDPNNYVLTIFMAMFRHIQGRFEDEVKLYKAALMIRPGDSTALNNLAWALSEGVHRPSEALVAIDELIGRFGRSPGALDTRGVILTRLDRSREAIEDLEESIRSTPSAIGHFHLALAYRKAGRDADYRASRELARRAGLSPAQADPTERSEVVSMLQF